MSLTRLQQSLINHEGKVKFAYSDSLGYLTIGIGRCIDKRKGKGLSDDEMLYLLNNDIKESSDALNSLTWFKFISLPRQDCLVEMAFNLGFEGLLEFKGMISAIINHDYQKAADEMRNSLWARQIGAERLNYLCNLMSTGVYD